MDEFTGMAFHSAEREVERQGDEAIQEAADLRRQLADMTKMRDAAARGVEIREEILARKTAEFKARLQAEIDLRTPLYTQDGEVDEFNAGYEACRAGQPIEAEPSELHFDVWRQGWMVADYERMSAEVADLRRQLAEAQETNAALTRHVASVIRERDEARREADQVETQLRNRNADIAELREQLAAERGRLQYEAGAAQAALLMQLADVQSRLIEAQTALAAVPVDAIRRYWHMSNPVESWDDAAEECVEVYRAMHQFLDEPDGAGCYADDWTPAHRPGKGDAR